MNGVRGAGPLVQIRGAAERLQVKEVGKQSHFVGKFMRNISENRQGGFSLVELMVALVLTFVVSMLIYKAFVTTSVSTEQQDKVLELNQNIRIGLNRIVNDLKMAGYIDPDNPPAPGTFGILTAGADTVTFAMDFTGGEDDGIDNDEDGNIDGADNDAGLNDGVDNDGDGMVDEMDEGDETLYSDGRVGATLNDPNPCNGEHITYSLVGDELMRDDLTCGAGNQAIVNNVDALDFVFLDEDDNVTATLADIRAVEVSLVVRTRSEDYEYVNGNSYTNMQGTEIYKANDDNFRRLLLTARVECRNIGI